MKIFGNLLMTACLLLGLLSAATSYLAPVQMPAEKWTLDAPDSAEPEFVHTNAPAGATAKSESQIEALRQRYERGEITAQEFIAQREDLDPVVGSDAPMTPEALENLRQSSVQIDGETRETKYVNVKRFSVMDWRHNWIFALSALGLFAGAMMVRTATKREIAAHAGKERPEVQGSPESLLATIRLTVDQVRADLPRQANDRARAHMIVDRIGDLQKNEMAAFVDARPLLIGRMGLGGYAELMDKFAAGERALNRAWSIAADGFSELSAESLETAAELFAETQTHMVGGAS